MSNQADVIKELELIKNILNEYPNGAFIEDIEQKIGLNISRRTLQRRLIALRNNKDLYIQGNTNSTKYFLQNLTKKISDGPSDLDNSELIPLSQEAKNIAFEVRKPIQQRLPIGYKREFLDKYQPNVSFYLLPEQIEKLEKISKTALPNQVAGTYSKEILSRLLIDLSWNSSRLEGNTYSLLDTQLLISLGQMASNKSSKEAQMILNHKDAIEFLTQSFEDIGFNRYTLLNLHALLSNNLLPDPSACGRLRTFDIGIHSSVFIPLAVPQLIVELFEEMLTKAQKIKNPFEQSFFIMVHLPYLQPFDDVNKRVSRLAANIPFILNNLSPLSFVDVPDDVYIQGMIGVYELNAIELLRDVFLWAYTRSANRYAALRQSLGEPDPFRLKYKDDIKDLISNIVSKLHNPKEASSLIKLKANNLKAEEREKFIQAVENELLCLHEGNFARYKIRPSEFKKWKEQWLS